MQVTTCVCTQALHQSCTAVQSLVPCSLDIPLVWWTTALGQFSLLTEVLDFGTVPWYYVFSTMSVPAHATPAELTMAALQLAPSNAEAWVRLGSCRFQLEQFSAAISPLRRAAQLLTPEGSSTGSLHLQDTLWLLIQVSPPSYYH